MIEEQTAELKKAIEQLEERIAALEKERVETEGLPGAFEIPGMRAGTRVKGFISTDGNAYISKNEALIFLGVSKNTGYSLFDEWEEVGHIQVEHFLGRQDYLLLSSLVPLRAMIWSSKRRKKPSPEEGAE